MNSRETQITGNIIGRYKPAKAGASLGDIVHVAIERRPKGPAENAFVFVEKEGDSARAKYISWINLYDIEHAAAQEPGAWCLVEERSPFDELVQWAPFGWGGQPLPNVAYLNTRSRQRDDYPNNAPTT